MGRQSEAEKSDNLFDRTGLFLQKIERYWLELVGKLGVTRPDSLESNLKRMRTRLAHDPGWVPTRDGIRIIWLGDIRLNR